MLASDSKIISYLSPPSSNQTVVSQQLKGLVVQKWECIVCGFIYDQALGLPEEGITPGSSWDDIPNDWCCPDCGVGKEDFEMVEID